MEIETQNNAGNSSKQASVKVMGIAVALLITVAFFSVAGCIYFFSADENTVWGRFSKKISSPAVVISGTNIVYTSTLNENLAALRFFYENQDFSRVGMRIDFSTEDGKKRLKVKEKEVLNKAVEDKIIEILAKKKGIIITQADADKAVLQKSAQYGIENEAEKVIRNIYGWDLAQFKERIVIPSLYAEKLREAVDIEIKSSNPESLRTITEAKKELDGGKDFTETMKEYSQGTVVDDKSSGWIIKEQLLPEIAKKIFSSDSAVGDPNEIIESDLGYHIIRVDENKKENGVDMVRMRQIFTRKKTFGDWLEEKMKDMGVNVLLREYYWDKENAVIEFKDQKMIDFEKESYENSEGDASVIF